MRMFDYFLCVRAHFPVNVVLCCVRATNVDFGSKHGKLFFAESTLFVTSFSDVRICICTVWPLSTESNKLRTARPCFPIFAGRNVKVMQKHVCDWSMNLFSGFFVNIICHRPLELTCVVQVKKYWVKKTWRDRYIWGPVIRCHVITQVGPTPKLDGSSCPTETDDLRANKTPTFT